MTHVIITRTNERIDEIRADRPGVSVTILDTDTDTNPEETLSILRPDGQKEKVSVQVWDTVIQTPPAGHAPPITLARYDDITYVIDGSAIRLSQYTDECDPSVLETILRATHPDRVIRMVDITPALRAQWALDYPDNPYIEEEGNLLAVILAAHPGILSTLPNLD